MRSLQYDHIRGRLLAALFSVLSLLSTQIETHAEEITFLYMTQAGYQPLELLSASNSFFSQTGHRVKILFPEYEDRYKLIQKSLSSESESSRYDIILLDHIWLKEFVKKDIVVQLPERLRAKVTCGIIPEIFSAFQTDNTLWAVPFHADFQLLYVNTEILQKAGFQNPPKTLRELKAMSQKAREKGLVKYPFFDSWGPYESLVCEYTWILSGFGGSLTKGNRLNIDTPEAREALEFMKKLLDEKIANPYSLQSEERFVNEVFCSGDALFVTNWTFLLDFAENPESNVREKWMPALMPVSEKLYSRKGVQSRSVCGFEGLAVMKDSRHKEIAWEFIDYIASPEFQRENPEYLSVWKQLWNEQQELSSDPYLSLKNQQLMNLEQRPSLVEYEKFSLILQNMIHNALTGSLSIDAAIRKAAIETEEIQ